MTYDIEDLVNDIEQLLRAKLNDAITAVEAEKVAAGRGASGILTVPNDAASYFQWGWNERTANRAVTVPIMVTSSVSESAGPFTKQTYTIDVGIVLSGTENDTLVKQKLLRYSKAFQRVFEENWGQINNSVTREKIETIYPLDFTLVGDSSEDVKVSGVTITATLA